MVRRLGPSRRIASRAGNQHCSHHRDSPVGAQFGRDWEAASGNAILSLTCESCTPPVGWKAGLGSVPHLPTARPREPPTKRVYSTQQDPIGIAGGPNVYGFAAGDPINFSDPFGLKIIGVYDEATRRLIANALQTSPTFAKMWKALHLTGKVVVTLKSASTDEITQAADRGDGPMGNASCEMKSGILYCDALFNDGLTGNDRLEALAHELVHTAALARRYLKPTDSAGVNGGCDDHNARLGSPGWGGSSCGDVLKQMQREMEQERERARDEKKAAEQGPRKP